MIRARFLGTATLWRVVAACLLGGFSLVTVRADEPGPKAKALLDEVIKTYQGLPAYADQGEFVLSMTVRGKAENQRFPISVSLLRPDKVRIDTPLSTLVSDGKVVNGSLKPLKKYTVSPAPKESNFDTLFTEGPVGSAIFGGPGGPPLLVPLQLLLSADPAKAIKGLSEEVRLAADAEIDGKPTRTLQLVSTDKSTLQLAIDPETKLLRAVDVLFVDKDLKSTLPESLDVKIERFRWTPGTIETKPPDPATFVYKAPDDFKKVDELTEAEAKAEAGAKVEAEADDSKFGRWVGKPAPEFSLTLLDGDDTSKTLSKAELAGKVVLIDFWATWCGPCLMELPEIQKLIEAYAKEEKGVVVVALSQDEGDADLKEVSKLVKETLRENKIVLTGNSVGKIGLDPAGKIGNAFFVTGLPSLAILDRDGVVRAVHVGFEPGIGETLRNEIDSLLEPKDKAK